MCKDAHTLTGVMGKTENNSDVTSRRMDKYKVVYTNDSLTAILKNESNNTGSFQMQTIGIHIAQLFV